MQSSLSQTSLKAQPSAVIETRGLVKVYRDKTKALDGLHLQVPEGTIYGLVGPDGAGKTTALEIIAGVMEPTSGTVSVLGKEPRKSRKNLAYVTQENFLFPDLTVSENIWYEAGLRSVEKGALCERRQYYLERMGLLKFLSHPAGKLSGGMKQKLALCCALIAEPKLLLLDEPSTGLDPLSRRELWQALHEAARDGVTILVATPSLAEANRCTHVTFINEGRIFETGEPDRICAGLGLARLEAQFTTAREAERAAAVIASEQSANVTDVYSLGSTVQILAHGATAARDEVAGVLLSQAIEPKSIEITTPTLEHVFVTRMQELAAQSRQALTGRQEQTLPEILVPPPDCRRNGFAIEAANLSKSFGPSNGTNESPEIQAVRDVSFTIGSGEIYGLLGANGAGKTTTIKMLCGLVEPDHGEISIGGETDSLRSSDVRRKIGYMSQKFTLYEALTVVENLQFYASIYEIPRPERDQKIQAVLGAFGLAEMQRLPVGHLPRGWKQRIAFGAAILHGPAILFLDEPTAGVDPLAARQLWRMITSLAKSGTAVLVCTHYLEEAEYCHRLGLMSGGAIVAQGSPAEIRGRGRGTMMELRCDDIEKLHDALIDNLGARRVIRLADRLRIRFDSQEQIQVIKETITKTSTRIRSVRKIPHDLEEAFISILT